MIGGDRCTGRQRTCPCGRCVHRRRRKWADRADRDDAPRDDRPVLDLPRFATPPTAPRRPYRED